MTIPVDKATEVHDLLSAAAELLPVQDGLEPFHVLLGTRDLQDAYVELLDIAQKHALPLLFWMKMSRVSELLGVP